MAVVTELCIHKSSTPYAIYDVDRGRVGTLYSREAYVIYGVDDWVTICFLNSKGVFDKATIDIPHQDELFRACKSCIDYPYGTETIDGTTYKTFLMRQRKNIYTAAGNYWGAVAANMLVATNSYKMGEEHPDWKLINYVKRSTDGKWIKVEGDGYSHGFVDSGLSHSSTYNTIPFYGSW